MSGVVQHHLAVYETSTGERMTWPHPEDPCEVADRLRYGIPNKVDLLRAASTMAAYRELVSLPVRTRNQRVTEIRKAVQAGSTQPAVNEPPAPLESGGGDV